MPGTKKSVTVSTIRKKITHDQTQEVVEHRDRLSNDPRDNPQHQADEKPGSRGDQILLVHAVGFAEESHVDILCSNVAVDNSTDDNLVRPVSLTILSVLPKTITYSRKRNAVCDLANHRAGGS